MEQTTEVDEITKRVETLYKSYTITPTFGTITGQPLFKAQGIMFEEDTLIEASQLYSSEERAKKALISFAEVQIAKNQPEEKPKISQPKVKKPSK